MEDEFANCAIACPHSGETIRVPVKSFSESDWLKCTDPQEMLFGLPFAVQDRKLRLFALACCHRIEGRLTHPLSRQAVMLADRYSNGFEIDDDMRALSHRFMEEYNARLAASVGDWSAINTTDLDTGYGMALKTFPANAASNAVKAALNESEERSIQCQLLRCIMGNPFLDITFVAAWLTTKVVTLAEQIYDERSFDRMPDLADALEEAGCDNDEILAHCRGHGQHVRGC